jgi:hypothetical protein
MSRRTGSLVNRRITVLVVVLVVAVSLAVHGAFSQASPSSNRKAVSLPDDSPKAPFSGAILSGNTLYVSGRIGIDSKTGNAPANHDVACFHHETSHCFRICGRCYFRRSCVKTRLDPFLFPGVRSGRLHTFSRCQLLAVQE